MKDLHVTVVPREVTIAPSARSLNQHDYDIDVAVQKKLTDADNAQIDVLVALVEEIGDHFRFKRLPAFAEAMWLKTEYKFVYAPEHLDQLRQFTGLLTLTFRVLR